MVDHCYHSPCQSRLEGRQEQGGGRSHFGSSLLATMGKTKSAGAAVDPDKRRRVFTSEHRQSMLRNLANTAATKTSLAEILRQLQRASLLAPVFFDCDRREIQRATESYSKVETPYGPLVQSMPIHSTILPNWDFINPLALLHYMSVVGVEFAQLMSDTVAAAPSAPLRIIVYIDEICPGNPLRPEKSRTLQCIYWAFIEWPQHVLQRMDTWPIFGVLRSKVASQLPGGISGLMIHVLRVFFSGDQSFFNGVTVVHRDQTVLVTGIFGGFMADEKALKELFALKGSSGKKPCVACCNVVRLKEFGAADEALGLVPLGCADPSKFVRQTKAGWLSIINHLQANWDTSTKARRERLETDLGINYDPDSLMYDGEMQAMIDPVRHYHRDWMHTLASKGVIGTVLAAVLHALIGAGHTLADVTSYVTTFKLPATQGKVSAAWFSADRIAEDHTKGFAAETVTMLLLLHCFLIDVVQPAGVLSNYIECVTLLATIVGILRKGATTSVQYRDRLQTLITMHAEAFSRLPTHAKPKFHQMFHLVDVMDELGKIPSCWVLERKHRRVKRSALSVMRHIEHTVTADLLNSMMLNVIDEGERLYRKEYLVRPKTHCIECEMFSTSIVACLEIGEVHKNDVVYTSDNCVGRAEGFAERKSIIVANVHMFSPIKVDYWDRSDPVPRFVESGSIVATVPWREHCGSTIRIMTPLSI